MNNQLKVDFDKVINNLKLSKDNIQLRKKNSLSPEDQLIEAYLLLHQKQEEEASLRFKEILEKQPKNVDAIMGLAVQLLRRGFLDDSLTWLTRGLEINPSLARAHYLRSSILFRQGDYLQGDLAIGRALEIDSANPSFQLLFLRRQLMKGKLLPRSWLLKKMYS